jgi:hypothetical protein
VNRRMEKIVLAVASYLVKAWVFSHVPECSCERIPVDMRGQDVNLAPHESSGCSPSKLAGGQDSSRMDVDMVSGPPGRARSSG